MKRHDITRYIKTLPKEGRFFFEICVDQCRMNDEDVKDVRLSAKKLAKIIVGSIIKDQLQKLKQDESKDEVILDFIKKSSVYDLCFHCQQQYLPLLNWLTVFLMRIYISKLAKDLGFEARFRKDNKRAVILAYYTSTFLCGCYFLLEEG